MGAKVDHHPLNSVRSRTVSRDLSAPSVVEALVRKPSLVAVVLLLALAPAAAYADPTVLRAGDQLVLGEPLLFETHGGTLLPGDAGVLDAIAAYLRTQPRVRIEIGAHTDARGSDVFNQRVTQSVADQVRMALIVRGIAAGRLVAVGYGETRPIAPNTTQTGRAANQRIELHVLSP